MPELPEVETTRRGIEPHLLGRRVVEVVVRDGRLRWPVPEALALELRGRRIDAVQRRAKYLLLRAGDGTAILHLGMSGSLRILPAEQEPVQHDHIDIVLDDGFCLRFRDPRRFGSLHWTRSNPLEHKLLRALGPEPLADEFNGLWLHTRSRRRRVAVKNFIMDSHTVVGVGNIYASEALCRARIDPRRAAGRISARRYDALAASIRETLTRAIAAGGTTLRDFTGSDGKPGYFAQELLVYGREGQPCGHCGGTIERVVQGARASYFCPSCQR
jgi:formamidopyrimidine-DNA glycosylase